MALKSTIFKATLEVANINSEYYQAHNLTIARHPSETDERMMVRLLAFALHANEALSFSKGLCADDEPDLWLRDLTGGIELWIEVGQPDERRIQKACGRAKQVVIYNYAGRSADIWWDQISSKVERYENLKIVNLPSSASTAMAKLAKRSMHLQCTIQDEHIWLAGDDQSVQITLMVRKQPG